MRFGRVGEVEERRRWKRNDGKKRKRKGSGTDEAVLRDNQRLAGLKQNQHGKGDTRIT